MIYTYVYILSETQQDRDRNRSTWAQTFLIFGQTSWEGEVGSQQEVLGWMQDWDECRAGNRCRSMAKSHVTGITCKTQLWQSDV